MLINLLKNSHGENVYSNWELTQNGGDQWHIEPTPFDAVAAYFCTSFQPCLKKQVIDLVQSGYDAAYLDSAPEVIMRDWYSTRGDCGGIYRLTVSLLNASRAVIATFKPADVTVPQGTNWTEVTHTFTGYGPGLRFISFEHGGQDDKSWKGWYGIRVTGSSVTIAPKP
ncbi:F-box only protein 2 isoform X2 [Misgurnus anguillicaudatus]|uniref:F-box only protein 2 isoform X2 n=1 Tax=Misgurnus anguillicaudatus TaxID=75329 RepID=UPI003CCF826D